jgi:hypothetical protein
MRIPYGISNFAALRRDRYFYADKTPFLAQLESLEVGSRYILFLRPRRFGKSLLLSISSGFDIIRHISQKPPYNAMAGFTR